MRLGTLIRVIPLALLLAAVSADAPAQTFRDRLRERLQAKIQAGGEESADADGAGAGSRDMSCADWSAKVSRLQGLSRGRQGGLRPDLADVAYGPEPLAKLDVYLPQGGAGAPAPVIMMVHGGGWCVGDKGGAQVAGNKAARWTPKGFLFVSVNYPMVAEGNDALAQAGHIAKAAAFVQANAARWGGDPARLILMGHSAGAHLVSLVNADAELRRAHGVKPLLGTVSLDAGAIDVVSQMPRVYPFLKTRYREAFGTGEAGWIAASPYHRIDATAAPWLGVCSTRRQDDPCGQARAYAQKSKGLGVYADVLPEAKSHGAINAELGAPGAYTDGVEAFMARLDPLVAGRLGREAGRP